MSDLAKFADLCRKKNIESIKIAADGTVELKLSRDAFVPKQRKQKSKGLADEVKTTELSEEEILFWSSTPAGQEGAHN